MPTKNSLKQYIENGFYHIYNRGVEKRTIFPEERDYRVFLNLLKSALSEPPNPESLKQSFTLKGQSFKGIAKQPKNFNNEVDLIAFCLMPNHFHLLIKQKKHRSIEAFMRSIITRFSIYFNKKYKRVGPLFQGRYQAVLVETDEYLLHLSRYIHLNPLEYTKSLIKTYSSYNDYLGLTRTIWVKPDIILSFFNQPTLPGLIKVKSYKSFVEDYLVDSNKILKNLTLETS